jgi:serine/threonine protein kinase
LKPRNILVNSNCDLKICDFGLAVTKCLLICFDYILFPTQRLQIVNICLNKSLNDAFSWSIL